MLKLSPKSEYKGDILCQAQDYFSIHLSCVRFRPVEYWDPFFECTAINFHFWVNRKLSLSMNAGTQKLKSLEGTHLFPNIRFKKNIQKQTFKMSQILHHHDFR